ncbi:MAG: glycosyltransferase family 4 protein, partial [Muribaculum sp.]|nr:glycosyltransferase family 4 protein [Muribaculum sp.]
MNILFITVSRINSMKDRGIYNDLMNELHRRGHKICIASPIERRFGKPTHLIVEDGVEILRIKTLNIQKTNVIEKGIGTLLLEGQFDRAIRKQWPEVKFDLVLYSTPPITFNKVIRAIKKRCGARSYLMLKDIFPQNAVDLGMLRKGSILHKMFRRKERELYALSDKIGCMSPANCRYVIDNNPDVDKSKVELCPNAIKPIEIEPLRENERTELLSKLNLPIDKTLFIYGGNLGKPQGLDFLLKVVDANEHRKDSHIIIVGDGTEYPRIKAWFDTNQPQNATLIARLPKDDYDKLVRACHVGLIFLDPRFTIPNFPSRLLSYLENSMPVLLATDPNTDMGRIAEANGFGLWSLSGDLPTFFSNMDKFDKKSINEM